MSTARSLEKIRSCDLGGSFKLIVLEFADGGHESSLHRASRAGQVIFPQNWLAYNDR